MALPPKQVRWLDFCLSKKPSPRVASTEILKLTANSKKKKELENKQISTTDFNNRTKNKADVETPEQHCTPTTLGHPERSA